MRTLSVVALAAAPIALAGALITTPPAPVPALACAAIAPIASGTELAKFTSSLFGIRHESHRSRGPNRGSETSALGRAPAVARAQPNSVTTVHLDGSCL